MTPNRLKQQLDAGKTATVVSGLITPDLIDYLGNVGFDAAWLDMEHGSTSWGDLADLSRACEVNGMSSIVRVSANDPATIMRTLDRGAEGIIVPHVNTRAEAEAVVDAAKYHPIGHRGVGGGRQGRGGPAYWNTANGHTLVAVMIEDILAVENLAQIIAVPHIDVFFVAKQDLAQSMGHLGQPQHPEVQAVYQRAIRAIVAAGRVAGTGVAEKDIPAAAALGIRFFMAAYPPWLTAASLRYLEQVRAATP
ncbi:MAG: hypothetical protein EXR49_03380 [Dehalococcoidia bacterium]|nr:hypothetical protein [Dehalococcoidia bacterium]